MTFRLTEEEERIKTLARDFTAQESAPLAAELDAQERFPREIVRKMGELGLMGIPIPREWGGMGASFLAYALAIEEISRGSASLGVTLAVHTSVGTLPVLYHGNRKQHDKHIRRLAQGEIIGAFALTEPHAGSDASSIKTSAILDGDTYVLNGDKVFITNAGEAGLYTVMAVTHRDKAAKGISSFLVEAETPGFSVGPPEKKLGLRSSSTRSLHFEDARVPRANRLREEGRGFTIAMSLLDAGRVGIGAQAVGIGQAALDVAWNFVREQKRRGQPIAESQAIQFKLADMATQLRAARLLVYNAARLKDEGLPLGKAASMAKLFATDTAMGATLEAIQILGDYGYLREQGAERLMRDAKATQIYEGTNEIQRIVIARKLLEE